MAPGLERKTPAPKVGVLPRKGVWSFAEHRLNGGQNPSLGAEAEAEAHTELIPNMEPGPQFNATLSLNYRVKGVVLECWVP